MFCRYCGDDACEAKNGDCLPLEDIEAMVFDGAVEGYCPECGDGRSIEPDARGYECWTEGCTGRISSPLILLGVM